MRRGCCARPSSAAGSTGSGAIMLMRRATAPSSQSAATGRAAPPGVHVAVRCVFVLIISPSLFVHFAVRFIFCECS